MLALPSASPRGWTNNQLLALLHKIDKDTRESRKIVGLMRVSQLQRERKSATVQFKMLKNMILTRP